MLALRRGQHLAGGGDDLDREQRVDRQAVLAHEAADATAEGDAAETDRSGVAERRREAVRGDRRGELAGRQPGPRPRDALRRIDVQAAQIAHVDDERIVAAAVAGQAVPAAADGDLDAVETREVDGGGDVAGIDHAHDRHRRLLVRLVPDAAGIVEGRVAGSDERASQRGGQRVEVGRCGGDVQSVTAASMVGIGSRMRRGCWLTWPMLRDARFASIGQPARPERADGPVVTTSFARYPVSVTAAQPLDPWRFSERISVRQYELDVLGHVNNAVYLNWAEQVAIDHVEALGFGRAWSLEQGGAWVVRQHHVTYHLPVEYGDAVTVTTLPQELGGVRGQRRTEIHRESDGALTTEVLTEWVWVRSSDGRPARVPEALLRTFSR